MGLRTWELISGRPALTMRKVNECSLELAMGFTAFLEGSSLVLLPDTDLEQRLE
jgi:hypothetical protein